MKSDEKQQADIRRRDPDVMFCRSCGAEIKERLKCEACSEPGCKHCLKENEAGEKLCEECFEIENDPQIKAARKAAVSGSYHDFHNYIKLRKERA